MANMTTDTLSKANGAVHEKKEPMDSRISESLQRMNQDAGTQLGAVAHSAMQTGEMYQKQTRRYVEENPFKSLAIAAASGIVIGGIITAFLSRSKN